MTYDLFQVDAFTTDIPFSGNPGAVCLLKEPVEDSWMQALAEEMNLSETAFLLKNTDGSYNLRWFTPTAEIDLCGHGTLASAHALWETHSLRTDEKAVFHSNSGILHATKHDDWIELDFPAEPPTPCEPPEALLELFSSPIYYTGTNQWDMLVELDSEDAVRQFSVEPSALKPFAPRGVLITSQASNSDMDIISRCFFPNVGVNEDPVTGSAHCCLGPYWAQKLNKPKLTAFQASKRGGLLKLTMTQNRVFLAGKAHMVFRGQLANTPTLVH